jgi:hypothetical protein
VKTPWPADKNGGNAQHIILKVLLDLPKKTGVKIA